MGCMISPTGKGIRRDTQGQGDYRASRGRRVHKGCDYLCDPGQNIVSPIEGKITRIAYPYAKDLRWQGCVIVGTFFTIKMFYFKPFEDLIKQDVQQGQHIGFAQNISKKYSQAMQPHIHLQIDQCDPNIFIKR